MSKRNEKNLIYDRGQKSFNQSSFLFVGVEYERI